MLEPGSYEEHEFVKYLLKKHQKDSQEFGSIK